MTGQLPVSHLTDLAVWPIAERAVALTPQHQGPIAERADKLGPAPVCYRGRYRRREGWTPLRTAAAVALWTALMTAGWYIGEYWPW